MESLRSIDEHASSSIKPKKASDHPNSRLRHLDHHSRFHPSFMDCGKALWTFLPLKPTKNTNYQQNHVRRGFHYVFRGFELSGGDYRGGEGARGKVSKAEPGGNSNGGGEIEFWSRGEKSVLINHSGLSRGLEVVSGLG